jgi:hydroxymethylbilane synthase
VNADIAIGSRGSALALAQARLVDEALRHGGHGSGVVIIETEGDRRAPDTAWGEGAFVSAIEQALLEGRVDIAVHSAKDVPTEEDPRLRIAAYLPRADPRDALVVRSDSTERGLDDLPSGARVGTDSPRRTGFLLARRPDLSVHPLHGNVDTRLRRLDAGETDALALACAGLDRLGLGARIAERLDPEIMPPAPGQGAIAVQVRSDDERMLAVAGTIDDPGTRLAVEAERAFLRASGGGCRAPIGALATLVDGELDLLGGYASPDGSGTAVAHRRGPAGAGADLADELATALGSRALPRSLLATAAPDGAPSATPRVLVTRAAGQSAELESALRDAGFAPVVVPAIAVDVMASDGDGALVAATKRLDAYRWVVVTSANGARAILAAAERIPTGLGSPSWATIGPSTRRILERRGIDVAFTPDQPSRVDLASQIPIGPGDRVLVVRGDLADAGLAKALRARGAEVDDVVAYSTREAPETSRQLLRTVVAEGPIAAAVFTSGSTVRGLVSLGQAESIDVRSVPAVCIGAETADVARAAGFRVLAVAGSPDSAALAAATRSLIAQEPP